MWRKRRGQTNTRQDDTDSSEIVFDESASSASRAPETEVVATGVESCSRSSVEGEETNTAFKSAIALTAAGSDIAVAAAEAEAMKNGWEVTICVCDAGGVPIQVKRNSFPASYDIAVGKAKTSAHFGKNTRVLEDAVNVVEGAGRSSLLSSPFVLMRGGVPFIIDGVICGAVGVSGVKPDQDEQIAKAGVAALVDLVWSHRVFESEGEVSAKL